MDKPIIVSYRWTAEEFLLIQRLHTRDLMRRFDFRRLSWSLGLVTLVMGVVTLTQHKSLLFVMPFLFIGAGLLSVPLFMRRIILKAYAQKPDRGMAITYELSENRLFCRSEVASSELLWRVIRRVLRTPEGFLLYPTENSIHWLPVHGFQNEEEIVPFAHFAELNVPSYEEAPTKKSVSGRVLFVSKRAKKYIAIWLSIFTLVLILVGQVRCAPYWHLVARGVTASGSVSEIFPGKVVIVRYNYVVSGHAFHGQGPLGPPSGTLAQIEAGRDIVVYYDPLDPVKSAPADPVPILHNEIIATVTTALTFPTFMIGLYLFVIPRSRSARDQAD